MIIAICMYGRTTVELEVCLPTPSTLLQTRQLSDTDSHVT